MDHCFERAKGGDALATRAIVEALRPRIAKMAAYYARRCGQDADDLLQEAWLGLLEALPQLDTGIGTPEQYLVQRARWRLLDAVRREHARRCASLEEESTLPIAEPGQDVPAAVCAADFAQRLSPVQRAVLDCLVAGLTWREAGRALGCTSANIAYHVRRIRQQYQRWVAG